MRPLILLLFILGCAAREDLVAPGATPLEKRQDDTAPAPWVLRVEGADLGQYLLASDLRTVRAEVVTTQPILLSWSTESRDTALEIEYRLGVEVVDPLEEEDLGWLGPWNPSLRSWERPEGFESGSPNIVLAARDGVGNRITIIFALQVAEILPRADQRPVLLIDDADESIVPEAEAATDVAWRQYLRSVQGYSTYHDEIDTRHDSARLNFATVRGYRGVVWRVGAGPRTAFARAFAPRRNGRVPFHWFQVYQELAGNVLLVGPGAATSTITPQFDANAGWRPPFELGIRGPRQVGVLQRPLPDLGPTSYPSVAWCLEAVDQIVPADTGSRNGRRRSLGCDAIVYARMSTDYVAENPSVGLPLRVLRPETFRVDAGDTNGRSSLLRFSTANMQAEEIYDTTVFGAPVELEVRDCQTVMYEAVARMDVDDVDVMQPLGEQHATAIPVLDRLVDLRRDRNGDLVEDCPAVLVDGRATSVVSGAPIAIASTQYTTTKQGGTVPFEDYLFGFEIAGFHPTDAKEVVEWILLDRWFLNLE